jgi:hypothetical protein
MKASLRLGPEISVCWVSYRDVLQNPQPVCETIQQFLGIPLDLAAMAAQVDPSLYRQRESPGLRPI